MVNKNSSKSRSVEDSHHASYGVVAVVSRRNTEGGKEVSTRRYI